VIGYHAGSGNGVYGESPSGAGLVGSSFAGYGIYTTSNSGTAAHFSSTSGMALTTGAGNVLMNGSITAGRNTPGSSNNAINAYSTGVALYANSSGGGGGGVFAEASFVAVQGNTTGTNSNRQAIRGDNASSATGYAGVFLGNVSVFGTLAKTAGSFIIDHPLDPENKFLVHSFVESPDMKNIYDGIVTTDANGNAVVNMPDWFQALNIDFRYQLTCFNEFAQAIVFKEMAGDQFSIKTDKPNIKVSWQVTGTRNDPYAKENRLPVEKLKTDHEKGKYIYPKGYGQGKDKAVDVIRSGVVAAEE
jgi:hypothetical protein